MSKFLCRYCIEIYCGRTYCGNADFNTMEECMQFAIDDGFCDKAVIMDYLTGLKFTVKIQGRK